MTGSRSSVAGVLTVWAGAIAMVLRLVPHPANFSSVGAMSLFGGAKLRSWHAFALPLGVMLLSDFGLWLFTGFDAMYSPLHLSRSYVYLSLLLYVVIGLALKGRETWGWIVGASMLGSLPCRSSRRWPVRRVKAGLTSTVRKPASVTTMGSAACSKAAAA